MKLNKNWTKNFKYILFVGCQTTKNDDKNWRQKLTTKIDDKNWWQKLRRFYWIKITKNFKYILFVGHQMIKNDDGNWQQNLTTFYWIKIESWNWNWTKHFK